MRIAIKANKIIDGIEDDVVKDKVIQIEDGIIKNIINFDEHSPSEDEKVFTYDSETILPGLIDVHVHLANSGITSSRAFRAESIDMDYGEQSLRGYSFSRDHMKFGFTSLRDMNAPGNVASNIRDSINKHGLLGPNILACG